MLPRDCILEVLKRLDIDGRRAVGLPPRRLRVPQKLICLLESRPKPVEYVLLNHVATAVDLGGWAMMARYNLSYGLSSDGESWERRLFEKQNCQYISYCMGCGQQTCQCNVAGASST